MKRDKSYYFLITGIFIVAALFLSLLCKVGSQQNVRITQTRDYESITTLREDAYEKKQDGASPSGVIHKYTFTIPDAIEHETCLGFYLFHQYASVSIDGECVYRIEPSGKLPMIKTPGYNWVTVPIYKEDRGKCLQVEIIPVYEGSDDEQTSFLLEPKHRIIIEQLKLSWTKLTICELLIFIGITLIIFAIYYWRKYKTGTELIALGLTA